MLDASGPTLIVAEYFGGPVALPCAMCACRVFILVEWQPLPCGLLQTAVTPQFKEDIGAYSSQQSEC